MDNRFGAGLSRARAFTALLLEKLEPVLPAVGAFVLVRLLCLVPPYLWASHKGVSFLTLLTSFDARWYIQIARAGYGDDATLYAMFPLLPALIRAIHGVLGLHFGVAAVAAAWLASLPAAAGLFVIGKHLYDRRTGMLLPLIWGALPHGLLESMAYTEGLFTAFSAWTLYCVLTRRWLAAGILSALAGLSRPTASSLVAVVGLAALAAAVRRRDGVRPWIAALLAPLGWFGYLGWVAQRTGHLDGWFRAQADWGSKLDGGVFFIHKYWAVLTRPQGLQLTFVALMLLLAFALLFLSVLDRQPWELYLFSALILASIVVTAGFFHSKARFLVPAFPLLLPIARPLAQTTWPRVLVILATMMCVSGAYSGYLLFSWRYSF
jgi:hypothetical protein